MSLSEKVTLITDGGSGIGRACGLLFARAGARVAVADRARFITGAVLPVDGGWSTQ